MYPPLHSSHWLMSLFRTTTVTHCHYCFSHLECGPRAVSPSTFYIYSLDYWLIFAFIGSLNLFPPLKAITMVSHSTATDWQSKILRKEYLNWLAVGHALSLMCDGLRPCVEREMRAFHQALLANLAIAPPCTCPRPPKHSCAWAVQLARCHGGRKPNSPK